MSNDPSPAIPWERFATFIRQLSHDLRNQLNAAELQSALINECTNDPELKEDVKRLRELVSQMGRTLHQLSDSVAEPKPNRLTYKLSDLLDDLRDKAGSEFPDAAVTWRIEAGDEEVNVDPQLIEQAVLELFANAARHASAKGEMHVDARASDGSLLFILRETKTGNAIATDSWGAEPLLTVSHGHYGLGLRRARAIIEAHGGELRAEYDAKTSALVTTLRLPIHRN